MRADRDAGYPWANPDAPDVARRSLAAFRAAGLPVWHVHHNGDDPADGFHPDNPLVVAMPEVAPVAGEPVIVKRGASAFIGARLQAMLRKAGLTGLVIVGGEANICVESSARMAGNLGVQTSVVADALVNFQRTLRDGGVMPPKTVLDMTFANLSSCARIVDSDAILSEISAESPGAP